MKTWSDDGLAAKSEVLLMADLVEALHNRGTVAPALLSCAAHSHECVPWPLLSLGWWNAWENSAGDYAVIIRGERKRYVGRRSFTHATMGRGPSFHRAALIALVRFYRDNNT